MRLAFKTWRWQPPVKSREVTRDEDLQSNLSVETQLSLLQPTPFINDIISLETGPSFLEAGLGVPGMVHATARTCILDTPLSILSMLQLWYLLTSDSSIYRLTPLIKKRVDWLVGSFYEPLHRTIYFDGTNLQPAYWRPNRANDGRSDALLAIGTWDLHKVGSNCGVFAGEFR